MKWLSSFILLVFLVFLVFLGILSINDFNSNESQRCLYMLYAELLLGVFDLAFDLFSEYSKLLRNGPLYYSKYYSIWNYRL